MKPYMENSLQPATIYDPERGHAIQTYSGRVFFPLDPHIDEIFLVDIAHALSMICRFGGHTKKFYSVAEHSFFVSQLAGPYKSDLTRWGLLHDASEAYLLDLVQPMKRAIPQYRAFEEIVMQRIAERFDLPWPMPLEIKDVDVKMLYTEKDQLLNPCSTAWAVGGKPFPIELPCWSPEEAELQFLKCATRLGIS